MDARSRATVRRRAPPRSPPCCCSCWRRPRRLRVAGRQRQPDAVALASPVARRDADARNRTPEPTASPTAAPTFPITLTDDEGTEVTIPAEPTKIVSLTPRRPRPCSRSALGDRVVGKVEDFTPYPPEVADVPDVAKFGSVDVEKIVACGADLVIAGGSNFNPPESIAKLRPLGVPVLVVFAPDVQTALDDMTLIGQAIGSPTRPPR